MKPKLTILSLTIFGALATSAFAQAPAIPTIARDGTITQVLVTPHGEPDGLLMQDGTLVRFPPHAVSDGATLRVGSQVHAKGEPSTTPNGITLFDARVTQGGRVIADPALPPSPRRVRAAGPDEGLTAISASGQVRMLLANPDGVIDGFILEDGTVVHAGPRARLSRYSISVGVQLSVTGWGGKYPQGRSLRAETLQVAGGPVQALEQRRPPPPAPAAPPASPDGPPATPGKAVPPAP